MYPQAQRTSQSRPLTPLRLALLDRPEECANAQVDLEIVVPVYNEERALSASIQRLHRYLCAEVLYSWRITIADNASTDATPEIARTLAQTLPGVRLLRLEVKGRGYALRTAWSQAHARVLAYMDVDLSTDLRALAPLVAPLLSGHSEVAIGTRLAAGSRVVRGAKREFISRSYNLLLRTVLRARFSDAQCGFKAVRADAAKELLADVQDNAWFFDTELLIAAQRRGMRIHEVAVDWVDDPDSRVKIVSTAVKDLRGIARLLSSSRLLRFMAVGVGSTAAYAGLFLLLAPSIGAALANAAALTLTAIANTAVNRRLTFGIRGRGRLLRDHLAGLTVFAIALTLTSLSLTVLHGVVTAPSHLLEASVLITASLCATLMRYATLSTLVFGERRGAGPLDRRPAEAQLTRRSAGPTLIASGRRVRELSKQS